MTFSLRFGSFMSMYKGFNYVLLALYTEEIENDYFKIKNVKEITYSITLLSEIQNRNMFK